MAKSFKLNLTSRSEAASKTMLLQNMIEGERPEYQYININNISYNTLNDYANDDLHETIRELANDIKRHGLLHNIVVSYTQDGKYKLLSGERRLRAYQLLHTETGNPKYQNIYALIRKGLTELEEVIILDAANLQTRGGMSGEKRYRKASVRFIENLKKQYNISEAEAIALTKQYAGANDAVIEKNIAIEKKLNPAILTRLDEGDISKQHAYEYSRLDPDIQQKIGEKFTKAQEYGKTPIKDINDAIAEPAKKVRVLTEELGKKQVVLKEIGKDIKQSQDPESKKALALQAEQEKQNLREIKKNIKTEVKKIETATSSPSLFFSSSLSLVSSLSSSLSSLIKNLPLSKLSSSEKEKVKKKIEEEKELLDKYIKENF